MHLYVHIPFCLSKCRYCALYSECLPSLSLSSIQNFPSLLAREFSLRTIPNFSPSTIYFGGGTPGLLGVSGFENLIQSLSQAGVNFSSVSEWTVELNPSPIITTPELLSALRSLGVNRLSFGAQSLNDSTLKTMGRPHLAADLPRAFALARSCGFNNIGLDLIAGFPGVSPSLWNQTLQNALALSPRHISVYGLIVEPSTPLASDIASGLLALPSDDDLMDLLASTESTFSSAGFVRYEISNYALPGFECQHNLSCWHGDDYLGLGPSAASRIHLSRRTNAPSLSAWSNALSTSPPSFPPASYEESLSEINDAEERFLYSLRLAQGTSPSAFASSYPAATPLLPHWIQTLQNLIPAGLVYSPSPDSFALTSRGREVADSVLSELIS